MFNLKSRDRDRAPINGESVIRPRVNPKYFILPRGRNVRTGSQSWRVPVINARDVTKRIRCALARFAMAMYRNTVLR